MKQSTFLDNQPFIYIFAGLFSYLIFLGAMSRNLSTEAVMLGLCNAGSGAPTLLYKVQQPVVAIDHFSTDSLFLNRYPSVLHFILFFATLGAFAGAVFGPTLMAIQKLVRDYQLQKNSLWRRWEFLALIILAIGYRMIIAPSNSKTSVSPDDMLAKFKLLFKDHSVHFFLASFIYLTAVICMVGLFVLVLAIVKRNKNLDDNQETETQIERELQWYFSFFSFSLSCLISGGVLSSVFLRDALYELIIPASSNILYLSEWKSLCPITFTIYYCLNFTILLLVILVPTFNLLRRSGKMALLRVQYKNSSAGDDLAKILGNGFFVRLSRLWMLILMPVTALFLSLFLKFLERMLTY